MKNTNWSDRPCRAEVLAAQPPHARFFMPLISAEAGGVAFGEDQKDGVPPGMIEFREIRFTRTIGKPRDDAAKTSKQSSVSRRGSAPLVKLAPTRLDLQNRQNPRGGPRSEVVVLIDTVS
jgi:hypothetical protein